MPKAASLKGAATPISAMLPNAMEMQLVIR